jgi:hypothetical protein
MLRINKRREFKQMLCDFMIAIILFRGVNFFVFRKSRLSIVASSFEGVLYSGLFLPLFKGKIYA